jgi:transcriptional regulator with XRE-family HTH domain
MNYAKAIEKARKHAKLSQRELGRRAGFDASYVSMLERGTRSPSVMAVATIAMVTGVSAATIHAWANQESKG